MRYALRALLRTPAFTAIAVVTLAVGIGTNTTIFAIVDELAFKPARVTRSADVFSAGHLALPDYDMVLANRPAGVEAIAAVESTGGGLLQTPGRAEHVSGWRVSGSYADVHRVNAQIGRWISNDDNVGGELDPKIVARGQSRPIVLGRLGADVAVISDRIWREWFHAAPDVVDRVTITLNRRPMRVVGVAPPGFETSIDLWTPFGQRRLLTHDELEAKRPKKRPVGWVGPLPDPTQPEVDVMLRKAAGVSTAVVTDRLKAAVAGRPASIEMPASSIRLGRTAGDTRLVSTGSTILIFAALIFVAACANLGNMLFARATEREGELAVRLSLGATRRGVFNLLFSETLLICTAGSAAGLLFAAGVLRLFTDAFPAFQVNYWKRVPLDLSVDWRIAAYATAAGFVAALVVGVGSLWRASRVSLLSRLAASSQAVVARTEGRTMRTMLVSVQVTAAVLLLIATGMLLENTSKRLNRRLLFDTGGLVSAALDLPEGYDESRGRYFFSQLLTRARSIDGVTAAALTDALPGGESPSPRGGVSAIVAEAPERGLSGVPKRLDGQWLHVSPGAVGVLGLALTRGRDFLESDEAGSEPVAIVSESVARRLWGAEDPIGRRLQCCGETSKRRIVGLVPDPVAALDKPASLNFGEAVSDQLSGSGPGTFVLLPAAQRYHASMLLVLRSSSPRAAVQPLRDAVAALDPGVPVFDAGPVDATQFASTASASAVRLLAGALGAIALGIAVLGVYAIVSYYVTRRAREFGLRLALGSTRQQIMKLVVDYAIHIILIGLLPGVLLASLGTRYFQAELRELHPNGLTVWGAVPVLMLVAGVVAAWIPARRAARIEPYRTLKDL
ncbi:MAG TPA: FtsX-like permease family protein [Vicinamibacterales bacterium]|nr:FtsX-like permease family protein [Vicinamibacterales bacterium]